MIALIIASFVPVILADDCSTPYEPWVLPPWTEVAREPDTAAPGEDTHGRKYVVRVEKNEDGTWRVYQHYLDDPE